MLNKLYRIKPLPFGEIPQKNGYKSVVEMKTIVAEYVIRNRDGVFSVTVRSEEYLDWYNESYENNTICEGTYEECRAAIESHYMERLLPALVEFL